VDAACDQGRRNEAGDNSKHGKSPWMNSLIDY
jgi:hypothetical protein